MESLRQLSRVSFLRLRLSINMETQNVNGLSSKDSGASRNSGVNGSMVSPLADYAADAFLIAVSIISVSGLYLLAASLNTRFH